MPESPDMDAPVTRRDLHEALEIWAGAIISRIEAVLDEKLEKKLEEKLQRYATKEDLKQFATKEDLLALEQRLMTELRQHTKASEIELASRLVAIDEQYKDLPARVTRLEEAVFAPAGRRVTARRRKRS